jgi:hypothetical protein
VQNLNTLSDKYGKEIDHWNGFDIGINARLENGLVLQGGVSSGKQVEDNCEVVAKLPEMNNLTAAVVGAANSGATGGNAAPAQWRPLEFCHREQPMLTGAKLLAIYTVPKVDVQLSGSFRSTPGTSLTAAFTATNAYLTANSTLGRPLSGGAANMVIGIEDVHKVYTDRREELDLRIGKLLRFGKTRWVPAVDVYNALNSGATITENQAYGSWLQPTQILNPRLIKFSVAFDF